MTAVLRWGILGCGNISSDFVTSLRAAKRPHKVVALGASSVDRATAFRTKLQLAPETKVFGSYDELLAQSDVDAVYIGVVNSEHLKVALKAIDAGKKVLCEKPLAVNSREVNQLLTRAEEKKVFLMEAVWSRFFPAYQRIREEIKKGELGSLKSVIVNFTAPQLPANRFHVRQGASPLSDIGLYLVQFANFVFPEKPSKITAVGTKNADGADLWTSIILQFPSGGRASLFCSGEDTSPSSATVTFSNGYLEIPRIFWAPDKLIINRGGVTPTSQPEVIEYPVPTVEGGHFNFFNSAGLNYEADHVYDRVTAGHRQSDIHSHEASRTIIDIIDEVRRQVGVVYDADNA